MNLTHKDLDDFEPLVRSINKMAFTSGLRELKNLGLSIKDLETCEEKIKRKFIKCCHNGYDKAQRKIVEEIVKLTNLKKNKEVELLEYRKKHDKKSFLNLKTLVYVIDNRILVLRRIIDAIAFTLFQGKPWIARRFVLLKQIKEIDTRAIFLNLKEANLLNEQDRLTFAIVCDLTTFIDVGDLLQIDFHKPAEWRLIELKDGKINKILEDILEREVDALQNEKVKEFLRGIGPHALKQAQRMVRQKKRIKEVHTILEKNEGIDIGVNMPIKLTEIEISTEHYDIVLNEAIKTAKEKGFDIRIIDKCLLLIACKNSPDHAHHLLLHFLNPNRSCAFSKNKTEEIKEEFKEMHSIPFVQDLTLTNMYSRSSTPFFSFPLSPDDMSDLLFNRISLLAYLDIKKFIELGSEKGCAVEFCAHKETQELLHQFGKNGVPMHNGKAIRVKTSQGITATLLMGTFTRMFHDLLRPSELFRMWNISPTELFDNATSAKEN